MCRAYRGVGALDEVDGLWLYCSMGLDLVQAVDDCQRGGTDPTTASAGPRHPNRMERV